MLTVILLIAWFFVIMALGVAGAFESLWNGRSVGPPLALLVPLCLYFADASRVSCKDCRQRGAAP
jgi:hypothetical protein